MPRLIAIVKNYAHKSSKSFSKFYSRIFSLRAGVCREHPSEHPSEHPEKKARKPAAKAEHPEHPTRKEKSVSKAEIAKGIKVHIRSAEKEGGGVYRMNYEETELALTLKKVHRDKLAQLENGQFFACTDFDGSDGNTYDVDPSSSSFISLSLRSTLIPPKALSNVEGHLPLSLSSFISLSLRSILPISCSSVPLCVSSVLQSIKSLFF